MAGRILVIDDDETALNLLRPFLTSKGYEVETARDGFEGLEKVKSWKPQLIILDVMMPKMDGYGFVREMKKDLTRRTIPIIVLTAREMMRDVFVQEGLKDFVVKPYDPEELLKKISGSL